MKNIGIIHLGITEANLTIASIMDNETFITLHKEVENLSMINDFQNNLIASEERINEVNQVIMNFKLVTEMFKCQEVVAYADYEYRTLKNEKSFFDKILNVTDIRFTMLSEKTEFDYIYFSCANKSEVNKGVMIYIDDYRTYVCQMNRRIVLNSITIPYGYCNIAEKGSVIEQGESIISKIKDVMKEVDWLDKVNEEYSIIGCGKLFNNISNLAKRVVKYSYDRDHGFIYTKETFAKVFDKLKGLDTDSIRKIKGVEYDNTDYFMAGLFIAKAIVDLIPIDNIINSVSDMCDGAVYFISTNQTALKPLSDCFEHSLLSINSYYNNDFNNSQIAKLSILLFKQLRVLHRLGRSYLKILKIASSLCNCGFRVNPLNPEKSGFYTLIHSPIYGVSHREIILAGFVLMGLNPNDFSVQEWAKYRDFLVEEDLIAVKQLSVMLKIAMGLDKYRTGHIEDVECDILGNCVILKTTVNAKANLEIRESIKACTDFKKTFGKNIEIL